MKRIAVLFSGKGTNFAAIVEKLHHQEFEVVFALTNNPEAEGRKVAENAGIPCEVIDPTQYTSRKQFDTEVVRSLQKYNPELTVLAGFMRILTPVFTEQIKAINLHPSLLPRHKGLNAIKKSYDDAYETGGVTIHMVSAALDGGETILQKEISKKELSLEAYEQKIRRIEKEALIEAIQKILI